MGLDNGISLKMKGSIPIEAWGVLAPKESNHWDEDQGIQTYEICYWRKCWNIREEVFRVLNINESDNKDYEIDRPAELLAIRDVLVEYIYDPAKWNDYDDCSIWEWDEIKDKIVDQIAYLTWLSNYMAKIDCPFKVIFYDSY